MERRAAVWLSRSCRRRSPLCSLATAGDDRLRRGEALGLHWTDVDMEAGTISIRRAWIPVNGIAQMSEPKTRRGRRTIALDP